MGLPLRKQHFQRDKGGDNFGGVGVGEIRQDDMRLAHVGRADADRPESARERRRNPRFGILEDDRLRRRNAEPPRRPDEQIGRGLAVDDAVAVADGVELVSDAQFFKGGLRVLAGGAKSRS